MNKRVLMTCIMYNLMNIYDLIREPQCEEMRLESHIPITPEAMQITLYSGKGK